MAENSTVPIGRFMTERPTAMKSNETIGACRNRMADLDIRHMPIIRNNEVLGLVTDSDMKLAMAVSASREDFFQMQLGTIALTDIYSASSSTPAHEVIQQMVDRRIGSALVIDEGRLVGIFTHSDACKFFARYLRGEL